MARRKSRAVSKRETNNPDSIKSRPSLKKAKKKTFWRRILKFLPLILLALAFNFFFHRAGTFNELETKILDAQMRLDMPSTESGVVIVEINQDDFDQNFQGRTRPLNPPVLRELIEKILRGNPCVVGVDIDTSFAEFGKLENFEAAKNVVWMRETEISDAAGEEPIPLDFLGGRNLGADGKSGLPILIEDKEKITRRYSRMIKTTQGDLPSLPWAVFREGKNRKQEGNPDCQNISFPDLAETTDQYIIGYSRGAQGAGRAKIPASHIFKLGEKSEWQNDNPIRGKIVLVGGTYLGEDLHDTPLGKMPGVEIIANVVETEMRGGGLKPPDFWRIVLLQIFDGVVLLALFHWASLKFEKSRAKKKSVWRKIFPWQPILFSLPVILVIAIICSLITYKTFSHWFLFVPVMLGILLTEIFDKVKDYLKGLYKEEIEETFG